MISAVRVYVWPIAGGAIVVRACFRPTAHAQGIEDGDPSAAGSVVVFPGIISRLPSSITWKTIYGFP